MALLGQSGLLVALLLSGYGMVAAFVGAPFFIWLIRRRRISSL